MSFLSLSYVHQSLRRITKCGAKGIVKQTRNICSSQVMKVSLIFHLLTLVSSVTHHSNTCIRPATVLTKQACVCATVLFLPASFDADKKYTLITAWNLCRRKKMDPQSVRKQTRTHMCEHTCSHKKLDGCVTAIRQCQHQFIKYCAKV